MKIGPLRPFPTFKFKIIHIFIIHTFKINKGKGLGKELHGRAVPVEAMLRKGKGAVGRYGAESKDLLKNKDVEGSGSDGDGEQGRPPGHVSQWKSQKAKLQYGNIRTPEELLTMAANNQKKLKKAEAMLDNKKTSKLKNTITKNPKKNIDLVICVNNKLKWK